jgi:energy-coupling factor transport system permease protein
MKILRDLTLGQYIPRRSSVHALDPRAKLGACLLAMCAAFLPGCAWGVLATWPLLGLGVALSGIPVGYYLRGFRPFLWLFAFTLPLHALSTPGTAALQLPLLPLVITWEGLASGTLVCAQLATAVAFSSLLTLTTRPVDLVWSLERLASPLARFKVPVADFGVTMLLAIRFFPILYQESERLLTALKARGIDLAEGGVRQRVRNLGPLVVPLLRQVFRRADSLALAMEIRGYRPGLPRTSWRARGLGTGEAVVLGLALATLAATRLG